MKITELKRFFARGELEKPNYIKQASQLHQILFEYSELIKKTDIFSIEIQPSKVLFHLKNLPFTLECPENEARVAPIEILNFDQYEEKEVGAIQRVLGATKEWTTILDIGANIGWFSLWFAHNCPQASIHAFEPLPRNFGYLQRNITANSLNNQVKVYNYGLSNQNGAFDFFVYPTGTTNASLKNVSEVTNAQRIVGLTITLDDWTDNFNIQPDFIKCDVEGAEFLVFQGGKETLLKCRPIVFTEMLRKWSRPFGYHPNDVIGFFEELGYSCYSIAESGVQVFSKMDDFSIETNFIFLHNDKHRDVVQELTVIK